MLTILGLNHALSIRAAADRERKGGFEKQSLGLGLVLGSAGFVAGWIAMPRLVPASQPDLIWLSRVALLHLPVFVITSNLMAIDQGCGDFRTFNLARNILTPVYLMLLLVAFFGGLREPIWFVAASIMANLAVLGYRLSAVNWSRHGSANVPIADLLKLGLPFWFAGIAAVLRDNAERLLLMFLLGPSKLGLYAVAFTASSVHLHVSRSLNLITFSRVAGLERNVGRLDAARSFRLMSIVNLLLSLAMLAVVPSLVRFVYGAAFSNSIFPACLLVAAQFFLCQGAILDEALRARANPLAGLGGTLTAISVFTVSGVALAGPFGLHGVAAASIVAQIAYCTWMVWKFRSAGAPVPLIPCARDFRELGRISCEVYNRVWQRLGTPSVP
jgi:O-antigen/teichoic acid export membrane protein